MENIGLVKKFEREGNGDSSDEASLFEQVAWREGKEMEMSIAQSMVEPFRNRCLTWFRPLKRGFRY